MAAERDHSEIHEYSYDNTKRHWSQVLVIIVGILLILLGTWSLASGLLFSAIIVFVGGILAFLAVFISNWLLTPATVVVSDDGICLAYRFLRSSINVTYEDIDWITLSHSSLGISGHSEIGGLGVVKIRNRMPFEVTNEIGIVLMREYREKMGREVPGDPRRYRGI